MFMANGAERGSGPTYTFRSRRRGGEEDTHIPPPTTSEYISETTQEHQESAVVENGLYQHKTGRLPNIHTNAQRIIREANAVVGHPHAFNNKNG
jgi:hypothetical protein